MNAKKKILMAVSNPWNSIFQVGSHHLCRELIRMGHEVAFISNPISPFHLLKGAEKKKRFELCKTPLIESNLQAYVPFTLAPPQNHFQSQWALKNWHRFTVPSIFKKIQSNGFKEIDLLYFDTAIQSFWLDKLNAKKSVFRIADKNSGFKNSYPALEKFEKKLIEKVDLVLCSAKTLADEIPGSIHFPNGVHFDFFAKKSLKPSPLKNIPKPIAIYVGALDYWFDSELLIQIAKKLPSISFVLIGPGDKNRFSHLKNIYMIGPKEYQEIPSYLQNAQVGIIPFNVKDYPDLIHSVNPLKLYEYMASSLPVVATHWKELENLNSPAYLSDSADAFVTNIIKALNSSKSECLEFAKKCDWSIRAQELIQKIDACPKKDI